MLTNNGNSREVLVDLLAVEMRSLGALHAALSGLHSLFNGPSPVESDLRFCHASFAEFLSNRDRSLEFYIDKSHGHDYLALCCLSVLEVEGPKVLRQSLAHKPGNQTIASVPVLEYAYSYWAHHLTLACGTPQVLSRLDIFNVYSTFLTRFQYSASNAPAYAGIRSFFISRSFWSLGDFLLQTFTIQAHFKVRGTISCAFIIYNAVCFAFSE
ncbi:hypothetical protein BDP27DRAFT_1496515 [Rhodocollybia butyracea]|uniref:Uncharacterized protein n=1 Tax=Rhodocollybia butyracea TaxID=206335 RepID=A0A9P5UAD9_9AGAR|nr:hypothetical protein BDP27DRAFT_1496515 [Rhodocollybia butyracea]